MKQHNCGFFHLLYRVCWYFFDWSLNYWADTKLYQKIKEKSSISVKFQIKKQEWKISYFQIISQCFSVHFIAFVCSINSPCISHIYCSDVSCFASDPLCDHWNASLSKHLYKSGNPSPSHSSAFNLSRLLPQNRNRLPEHVLSPKFCWTIAASPSINCRISVYPQTMYTDTAFSSFIIGAFPEE